MSKKVSEKISIIVPVYNLEGYIRATVKSICKQTYKNLEIILVNDGSSDDSYRIMNELAHEDQRIKCIDQDNGGVTKARLTGVAAATGEWITFVDGDDFVEPEMYERLLNNAEKYKAQISHCGYQMVFPSRTDYYYNTGRLVEQDKAAGLHDLLSASFVEPGLCNKLFHHTLFHGLLHDELMDLSIKNNEDLLMNYYLFSSSNKSVYEDFCPYHYVVRANSASTCKINKHKLGDAIKVFETIKGLESNNEEVVNIINSRLLAIYINNATLIANKQPELIKPFRKAARRYIRKNLVSILKGAYSGKYKIMAAWVAVWPFSYSVFHRCISALKGTNRKYVVE